MPVPGESLSPDSRRKLMEEERSQKKLMNQRVAAVREVVHNKSNDDIIMALHNFDMDVERTIQAFCDDSAQAALDTWTTGPGKNKKKKGKKGPSSASPLPPYSQSETPTSPPGSVANGDLGTTEDSSLFSHHLANGTHPQPQRIPGGQRRGRGGGKTPPHPQRPIGVHLTNGGPLGHPQHKPEQTLDPFAKKKAGDRDLKTLAKHDAVEERVQSRFNEEISKAGERIRRSFEEMRNLLESREAHLQAELIRCKEKGNRILGERIEQGKQLHIRSERTAAMSEKEIADLRHEIKVFTSERRHEEELGSTIRFQWDPDPLIALIKNFGEVVGVKEIGDAVHKHSTSQSSLASSMGEDSGLGMTSPVSPSEEEKKGVAEVEGGGIVMKSESLTAEQLEDLNRRLQESLQLQGITADILQGVGGGSSMPARRPRPPPGRQGAGARGGGGGRGGVGRGSRGGRGRGGGGSRQPNLSIFAEET